MIRLRSASFLGLWLSLVLALASVTLAHARGQARIGDTFVLCTGGGAVTVTLDAEGNPTGPAHICPDMALALMAGVAAMPASVPVPQVTSHAEQEAFVATLAAPVTLPVGEPRGPPPGS